MIHCNIMLSLVKDQLLHAILCWKPAHPSESNFPWYIESQIHFPQKSSLQAHSNHSLMSLWLCDCTIWDWAACLRIIVFKHNLQEIPVRGADMSVQMCMPSWWKVSIWCLKRLKLVLVSAKHLNGTGTHSFTCVSLALIAVCCSSCLLQFLTDHISWRIEIETCDSANMLLHQRAAQQEYSIREPMTFAYPLGTTMLLQAKTGNKTPCRVVGHLCCARARYQQQQDVN